MGPTFFQMLLVLISRDRIEIRRKCHFGHRIKVSRFFRGDLCIQSFNRNVVMSRNHEDTSVEATKMNFIAIFRFFKMAAVHHLGYVWDIFGPPTKSDLYHCVKFGYNRCSRPACNFDNMKISVFGAFGLKCFFYVTGNFLGDLTP